MILPLARSTIRPWSPSDRIELARNADNPRIAANLRDAFPHPYSVADADRFIAMCEQQSPRTFFALEVDGEAAGGIGLSLHRDVERVSAELGYWLAEKHWGRGIVSEAVRALTDCSFERYSLTRVYALPYVTNPASARVLEKAGFVLEGRLRRSVIKHGTVLDQFLYAAVR